jgi:hypothetical protein
MTEKIMSIQATFMQTNPKGYLPNTIEVETSPARSGIAAVYIRGGARNVVGFDLTAEQLRKLTQHLLEAADEIDGADISLVGKAVESSTSA